MHNAVMSRFNLKGRVAALRNAFSWTPPSPGVRRRDSIDGYTPGFSYGDSVPGRADMPVLWACVSLISDSIANRPFYVAKVDPTNPSSEGEFQKDHPINTLLKFPSSWMDRNLFWSTLMWDLLVSGNAYAYIRRHSKTRRPADLILAKRQTVINRGRNGGDVRYLLRLATESGLNYVEVEDTRQNIIQVHGSGYNVDRASSDSPIVYAGRSALRLAKLAGNYQDAIYTNSPHQRGFLQSKEGGGDQDFEVIQKGLMSQKGVEQATSVRTLPHGWVFEKAEFTTIDLAVIDVMRWTVEDIARLYGVPPHMIGHMESNNAWGTGLDNLSIGFVQNCLRRHAERLESALNRVLLTTEELDSGLVIRIDLSGAGYGSEDSRMGLAERAVRGGLMTVNDARSRYLGLQEISGGDELHAPQGQRPEDGGKGPGGPAMDPSKGKKK